MSGGLVIVGVLGLGISGMVFSSSLLAFTQKDMICQYLPELCGMISTTPGSDPTVTGTPSATLDCTSKARAECEGKRGKERDRCIGNSKKACLGTSSTSAATGDATVDENVPSESPVYGGSGGSSQYNVQCPSGSYIKQFGIAKRDVGVSPNRNARVVGVQLQCSDGSWKVAAPPQGEEWSLVGCSGYMTGATAWDDGKIVQRIWPSCDGRSTLSRNRDSKRDTMYGSAVGKKNVFECPPGKKLAGISGWSGRDLDSVKFYCK